jgi:hypothetical protein
MLMQSDGLAVNERFLNTFLGTMEEEVSHYLVSIFSHPAHISNPNDLFLQLLSLLNSNGNFASGFSDARYIHVPQIEQQILLELVLIFLL